MKGLAIPTSTEKKTIKNLPFPVSTLPHALDDGTGKEEKGVKKI